MQPDTSPPHSRRGVVPVHVVDDAAKRTPRSMTTTYNSNTFVFDVPSGQEGGPVRYSLEQYREYSDADFALLAELDREIEAMCGEILSRAAEPDPF